MRTRLIDVPAAVATPARRSSPPNAKQRPSIPAVIALGVLLTIVLIVVVRIATSPNVAVRFYGRVVDEQGAGVPGVQVSGEVWSEALFHVAVPWTSSSRWKAFRVATDDSGNFTVEGFRGVHLHFNQITKRGYTADLSGMFGFNYDRSYGFPMHQPDPAHPVLFRAVQENRSGSGS